MNSKLYILILFLLCGSVLHAQKKVKLSGRVIDANNEGIELASIRIEGTTQGTMTDLKGNYEIYVAPADTVVVIYSCLGYRTERKTLLSPKQDMMMNVRLYTIDRTIKEVVVTEHRKQTSTLQRIDSKDLKLMPDATGGSIEAMLTTMAGVNSSNELSSQYSVRGGNFDENIVYVNGIEVYRPLTVRSGQQEGLSFINPDLVGSIGFSSGGYSAEYGDKMSSVLDITYKQPEAFEGAVAASFLGASASVGQSTSKFSQLHGFRFKTNSTLLSSLDTKGEYKPSFFDYQTLIAYKFSPQWKLSFLGNVSNNTYKFTPQERTTKFGTSSNAAQFKVYFDGQEKDKFQSFFGALSLDYFKNKNTAFSLLASAFVTNEIVRYDISGQYWLDELDMSGEVTETEAAGTLGVGTYHEHARNRLNAGVMSIALKGVTRIRQNDIKWGLNYQMEKITDRVREWEMRDSAGYSLPNLEHSLELISNLNSKQDMQTNRISAYVQDTYRLRKDVGLFTFTGGIRASFWDFNKECIVSPRVSVGFIPAREERLTLRFATGIYYQAPFYKEFRDTVRDERNNLIVALNRNIKSQRSIHFVLGQDFSFRAVDRPFKFTAELYYKKLDNLIPYEVDNVKIWYSGRNESKGYAAGLDMKLFGQFVPGTDSWLSFSLMKTQEKINGKWVPRPTEQRYSIALFFQDYVPRFPKYKFNLRAIWSDGLPIGAPKLGRQAGYFRTTPYRRVDIGASRLLVGGEDRIMRRGFFRHFKSIWIGLDIFNLLNISNVNSYYWVTDVYSNQYAVPNYLTMRQFNLRLSAEF
ncbi:TonB-dependent receptor [Coprobacter secundus]|uniref:TonB-dependent receptor n=1 Tax=Coprobacter secundus TaxID=1501392 RepID=UPI003522464C